MALLTIAVGLFFVLGGLYVLLNPRIQGARDAKLITSDEVSSAEQGTAYVGGTILVLIGLGFVFLGL